MEWFRLTQMPIVQHGPCWKVREGYTLRSLLDLGLESLRHLGEKAETTASVPHNDDEDSA